jgi:hypothetical protein
MALPNPLYAILETGVQVEIVGAAKQTRKPIIVYDGTTYRDTPSLVVGGAAGALGASASASVSGGVNPTVSLDSVTGSAEAVGAASVSQEDAYTHIPQRFIPRLDTLSEFWDADTVGLAMTMSVTTASGSAVITVPDATLLTPGQGISGTGIPANTTILSILSQSAGVITTTTAVMSQQATATGTVSATLTGSNKVGEFMQSEFIAWGSGISTPT